MSFTIKKTISKGKKHYSSNKSSKGSYISWSGDYAIVFELRIISANSNIKRNKLLQTRVATYLFMDKVLYVLFFSWIDSSWC